MVSQLHTIGLPSGQSHVPAKRFNVFHLNASEVHLDSFQVQIFTPPSKCFQSGLLHVCSRSLTFDPEQLDIQLLKMPFQQNFSFDMVCGD